VIGYYVHHHGRGHLHRAQALARRLDEAVTGLSSFPRPTDWSGPWLELPRDDTQPFPLDVTAGGQLHWVPRGDPDLRARSAALSVWIEQARPRLVVVDVSVEIALLARLHGVPVVSVVLPGRRTDPAHLLGYRVSSVLVAFSPLPARQLVPGLASDIAQRVTSVGAVSRFAVTDPSEPARHCRRHVVVLQGQGGGSITPRDAESLRSMAPDWDWTVIGGPDSWVEDPSAILRDSDVVVTNAGESALADVAAHRRPAIVIPAQRPFAEQATTAAVLDREEWPAIVVRRFPDTGWPDLLRRAAGLDGARWQRWCDGHAPDRFAQVVADCRAEDTTPVGPFGLRQA
jgi:Glycosyltransferase family 28 C-terminal domain